MAKLALGAAQFGMDYGLTNRHGRTDPKEVVRILEKAADNGISLLDTAPLYGASETVLGESLDGQLGAAFRIVTKTPAFHKASLTSEDADSLERTFFESLKRLRRPGVYGLLLHHCEDAMAPGSEILFERMSMLRANGLVQKMGVSAYSPAQVDQVIERHAIDIVQAPFNLLDQRFRRSGCFARVKKRAIEVHTRSAFLQGSLLADPASLPSHFAPHLWRFEKFSASAAAVGMSRVAAALKFVLNQEEIDCCIVGVTTFAELQDVLQSLNADLPAAEFEDISSEDDQLVNPSRWRC